MRKPTSMRLSVGAIGVSLAIAAACLATTQPGQPVTPPAAPPSAKAGPPLELSKEQRAFVGRWSVDLTKLEQTVRGAVRELDEPKRSENAMFSAEFATVTSFDIRDDGTVLIMPEAEVLPWTYSKGEVLINRPYTFLYKVARVDGGLQFTLHRRESFPVLFVSVARGTAISEADYRGEWEVDQEASLAANDKQLQRWFACAPGLSKDLHDRLEAMVQWQVKQLHFKCSLDAKAGTVSVPRLAPTPVTIEVVDDTVILSSEPQLKKTEPEDEKKLKPLPDFKMALRRDDDCLTGVYNHTTFVFKKMKAASPEKVPAEKPDAKTPAVQK
jgi:hypothetical protein